MVRDVMTKAVKTARIDTSVRDAARKMNKFFIGSILIIDKNKLVGILTERDILRSVVEQGIDSSIIKVKDIMSSPVITIYPDTSIEDAAQLMVKKQIKKLPVVDDGKLVGIVTSMDLMKAGPTLVNLLEDLLRRESYRDI
jgi:CBS-domain-containing membrane protein